MRTKIVSIFIVMLVILVSTPQIFALPIIDERQEQNPELPVKEEKPRVQKDDIIMLGNKKWLVVKKEDDRVFICPYHGDEKFYGSSDWGWFYGEQCRWMGEKTLISRIKENQPEEIKKQKEQEIPWDKVITDNYLSQLDASHFRDLYTKVREVAIMEPTEKHIHGYIHITDFMRRKSLAFAHATQDFVLAHPVYDIQKNTGTTSWSYPLVNEIRRKQRDALFKRVSNRAGLYFFVSGACPYCKEQAKIVHWFSADYGWNVISVARDFCTPEYPNCMVNPDLFTVFRATYTPSLFLIYRRSDNKPAIFPVGNGLTDYQTLKSRIFYYLKQLEEEKNQMLKTEFNAEKF